MSLDSPALGAAGCIWSAENQFCGAIQRTPGGYRCTKYGVELKTAPRVDEPFRAEICGDDAMRYANPQMSHTVSPRHPSVDPK
jgi:hypothetical protein